jgi:TRAP-type C4-dicarboxylate transport system permease small subunit
MSEFTPGKRGDRIIRPIARFVNAIFKGLIAVFLVLTVALVAIVSTDVVLRWFGKGIIWADEMSRMLMIWMAFVAMSLGVEVCSHVEITMFFKLFPKKFQKVWMAVNHLIIIAIGGFIIYYGILLIAIAGKGRLEIVRVLPKSVFYLTIPIGGFFIIYFALMHLLHREDLMPSSIKNFYPCSKEDATDGL